MEKPVVIYSSWMGSNYDSVAAQKDFAIYSNYLAQKAGFKTILYTDQKSKQILKDIPYNEIIDLDEKILEQLPKTVWAAGKILAMSMQTGPFMHIDFDFFILKTDFLEDISDKDFFLFHEEPWTRKLGLHKNLYKNGTQKVLKITDNIFNLDIDSKSMSLNFSIFGSCKRDTVKVISKEAKDFIFNLIKKREILENPSLIKYLEIEFDKKSKTILSMIIEQIIFPNILVQKYKYQYHPILKIKNGKNLIKKFKKAGLVHLWSGKDFKDIQILIRKNVDNILNKCN
jgi:hypothetical protein